MKINLIIVILWILFIFVLLSILASLYVKVSEGQEKLNLCTENNGITRTNLIFGEDCVNESGIYVIVKLNDEWRMIK